MPIIEKIIGNRARTIMILAIAAMAGLLATVAMPSPTPVSAQDNAPSITGLEVTSTPGRSGGDTYGVGEVIEIEATFSTAVDVADGRTPGLGLWSSEAYHSAKYLRGSGTAKLVFGFTVRTNDVDSDGISMDGGYQDRNGVWHNLHDHTAITAAGTDTVVNRAYTGLDDQANHKVDGRLLPIGTGMEITSSPENGDTYRYGETIEVALSLTAPVDVVGSKHLNARVGTGEDTWRGPQYQSGSGTKTLVFAYTVKSKDYDTDGFRVENSFSQDGVRYGWGGSGTVKVHGDVHYKGDDVVVPPNFTGLSDQAGHQLDGRPYPKTISITSTPLAATNTYGRGEVIQVSVNFGQNVDAGDNVFAIIQVGSVFTQRHPALAAAPTRWRLSTP